MLVHQRVIYLPEMGCIIHLPEMGWIMLDQTNLQIWKVEDGIYYNLQKEQHVLHFEPRSLLKWVYCCNRAPDISERLARFLTNHCL